MLVGAGHSAGASSSGTTRPIAFRALRSSASAPMRRRRGRRRRSSRYQRTDTSSRRPLAATATTSSSKSGSSSASSARLLGLAGASTLAVIARARASVQPYAVATAAASLVICNATWNMWHIWLASMVGLASAVLALGGAIDAQCDDDRAARCTVRRRARVAKRWKGPLILIWGRSARFGRRRRTVDGPAANEAQPA